MFCSAHVRFKTKAYDMEKQDVNAILGIVRIGVNFWYSSDWSEFVIREWFQIILGYQGSLIAMLTYPARSKAIDTFADLLELPEEATIGTFRWSSMNEILRETSDSILKVCSPCSPNNTGAGNITSHGLGELG